MIITIETNTNKLIPSGNLTVKGWLIEIWSGKFGPINKKAHNKPKEYPQQRETKTVAKEDVYCPALFTLEVGRASCNHGTNAVWKKTLFQKRLRYCGQQARSSCKGFSSQRIAVRLTLHFIYLTYIIHIFFVLYITYIFYTIF